MNETKIINRLSTVGIAGNIALVVFKLYAGIAGHSGAMVSDAVHSLSDVFATLVAYIGVRISKKAPDQDHPYGHDRLECVASMILGMILLATGFGIGLNGVKQIAAGHYEQLAVPSAIALAAAVVSIVSKEVMFWYTRYYAKKLNSSAFMADAWHHRSDALSSVGSLIGIGGAMLGLSVENGYVGEIDFAPNGLPTSYKKDHGVGLASVAATVKRHNGTLSIAAKDGVFSAHILLSL